MTSLASQSSATQAKQAPPSAPKVGLVKPPSTDAEKIKSALSAAPAAIAQGATIMEMPSMKVLKQGTNGWTCIPDAPTPGVDPMCLDKNGMEWANAWMNHKDPPKDKMALAYMMIMNIADRFAGYPTAATNTKVPYVMFAGTPYAHLMIPIK